MTREETIARIKDHKIVHKMNEPRAILISEALDMAIKALEQEPCEDAISRQAVVDMTGLSEWFDSSDSYNEFVIALSELPPVTPQPKIGHWIADIERWGDINTSVNGYRCSECNSFDADGDYFCPNCGAKMQVESEDDYDR